ncbi:MAG: ABC transporter substrate-binding protein [Haloglomus sp.]
MTDTPSSGSEQTRDSSPLRRRSFLTAAGAGATTALAGCTALPGGGGGGSGPIKIGGVYLLSGIASALGTASAAAARAAISKINKNGGIMGRDVEFSIRDHGSNPQQTIKSVVQEFGADVMIGLTSSGVTLNSAPTIESLGIPFTLTDIGTPYITEYNTDKYGSYYESDTGKAAFTPNIFRTNANTSINTYAMAKYAMEKHDVTRVANLGPDYAYGQQCWDYFKAYSDGLGADYEYVASEFPSLGASDMTPQINSVLEADPDLVFTSFWAGDTTTFVSQAVEQGLFEQVTDVMDTIGADPTVFSALGDTMPEGYSFSGWYWHSAFDNQYNKQFLNTYADLQYVADEGLPTIPSFTGGSTWAAIHIYKKAIEAAGSLNSDDIIAEMEGMTFEKDPRGPITIDPKSHQATAPTVVGKTSTDDDVPYDGVGLSPTQTYTLDRKTALDLLEGSGLGPGV